MRQEIKFQFDELPLMRGTSERGAICDALHVTGYAVIGGDLCDTYGDVEDWRVLSVHVQAWATTSGSTGHTLVIAADHPMHAMFLAMLRREGEQIKDALYEAAIGSGERFRNADDDRRVA